MVELKYEDSKLEVKKTVPILGLLYDRFVQFVIHIQKQKYHEELE